MPWAFSSTAATGQWFNLYDRRSRLGHALGEGLLIDRHPEGCHLGDDLDRLILQVDDVLEALTLFHPRVEDVVQFVEVLHVGGRVGEYLGGKLPEPVSVLLFLGDLDLKEPL